MTTTTKTLAEAFIEAQAEMKEPALSGINPAFKSAANKDGSKFVPLDSVLAVVKPSCNKHGIGVMQWVGEGGMFISLVGHGERMDFGPFTMASIPDPQKFVAACTYAARKSMMLLFCLSGDHDDDGNTAAAKPADKPADDPEFDRIMKLAQKNGTLDAVKRAVCDPYDAKAARAIFSAYSTTERQVLESLASKVTSEVK